MSQTTTSLKDNLLVIFRGKYFSSTTWQLIERSFSIILSFTVTSLIIKSFGPEQYGKVSYTVSFVSIFSFIASLGIDISLYKEVINNAEHKHKFIETGFFLKLLAGVIAFVCVNIAAFTTKSTPSEYLYILLLSSTFLFLPYQTILHLYRSNINGKIVAKVGIANSTLLNILKIAIIFFHGEIILIIGVLALEPIIGAIIYISLYTKTESRPFLKWRIHRAYVLPIIKSGLPFIAINGLMIIYGRIDQVFIKHFLNTSSAGIYDAGVKIAEAWLFLPSVIITSLYPALLNARKISIPLYLHRLRNLSLLILLITSAASLAISYLAPFLIRQLYGPSYMDGVLPLQIYLWSSIGFSIGTVVTHYLTAEDRKGIIIATAGLPAALNIVFNIFLIPRFQLEGAAVATLLSYSTIPFIPLLFSKTRKEAFQMFSLHGHQQKNS